MATRRLSPPGRYCDVKMVAQDHDIVLLNTPYLHGPQAAEWFGRAQALADVRATSDFWRERLLTRTWCDDVQLCVKTLENRHLRLFWPFLAKNAWNKKEFPTFPALGLDKAQQKQTNV